MRHLDNSVPVLRRFLSGNSSKVLRLDSQLQARESIPMKSPDRQNAVSQKELTILSWCVLFRLPGLISRLLGCLFLLILAGTAPLSACEPILPLFLAIGGSATLAQSFIVLLVAILIKSAVYAWLRRERSARRAFEAMVAGNALSSVVGAFAGAVVAGLPLIGLTGIAVCAILPARRLAKRYPRINRVLSTFTIVFLMTTVVFGSLLMWAISQAVMRHSPALYWSVKIGYVFIGLLCGLFITVFWEEWVIWEMSDRQEVDPRHFSTIVTANVVTLGLVAIYAAVVILPQRLASPDFLVELLNRLLSVGSVIAMG